ncbi:bacterial transcriptional activator domain-containing protein [Streptomyces sp. NPDC002962]|uniref:bacterial transcriptional activator domain-containing protein n=1 Tax=Streptomyces sp. NPDC002962 TaxID=3364674 RepID=UPI0036D1AF3F
MIEAVGQRLYLSPSTSADLYFARNSARKVMSGSYPAPEDSDGFIEELSRDLLPGWHDDWIMFERERWDQTRLYALESLAQKLHETHQYLPALQAALAASAIDQIRESAHRIIIEIHLSEGNVASALKRYRDYREMLHRELQVAPSAQMTQIIRNRTSS